MTQPQNNILKLVYIPGLRDIVFDEVKNCTDFSIIEESQKEGQNSVYIEYTDDFKKVKELKSVSKVYVVSKNSKYNPLYVSNHKSVLADLVRIVIDKNDKNSFNTFKLSCAGSDTKEVQEIKEYIKTEFNISENDESDLKMYIAKIDDIWEVGIQITSRPLSLRDYKIKNMPGAMDPTIAFAVNYLCNLSDYKSYLNIFSGSGTLMIEAALKYENLEKIIGFDNNKEHLSGSIQNIKQAGLIKKVFVKEFDIFDQPDLGKFDVITADLPFGMAVSKGQDLEKMYKSFIEYCEKTLNENGKIAAYTSEFKILKELISDSKFKLEKEVKIDLITNEEQYLPVKILILGFK